MYDYHGDTNSYAIAVFLPKARDVTLIQKVAASPKFERDRFWLNGEPDLAIERDTRFIAVIKGVF